MSSLWHASVTIVPTENSVLVIDDEPLIAELIQASLEHEGYTVSVALTGREGIAMALERQPHLILLDVMLPDMDGMAVCAALRANTRTSSVPIIMLSALDTTDYKVAGFEHGADDYIAKPFHVPELLARVRTQLRHVANNLLSELTGLPGNTLIERAIKTEVERGGDNLAILYIDIDEFKAYNDAYGFLAGNEIIRFTGGIAREVVLAFDREQGFCGHVGGDDFVVVTRTPDLDAMCEEIIGRFERQRAAFYSPEDRTRGYIVSTDRRGNLQTFPLVSLSIGVVTTRHRAIKDEWEVSYIAAEVKRKAKSLSGNSYYVDQRGDF